MSENEAEKNLQHIDIISRILNLPGPEHDILVILADFRDEEESVIEILNDMYKKGILSFGDKENEEIYDDEITLANCENFVLIFNDDKYHIPLYVASELCDGITKLILQLRAQIYKNNLAREEEKNNILSIKHQMEYYFNEATETISEFEKTIDGIVSDANNNINENLENSLSESVRVTNEAINKEMSRDGKIGTSLENTQKDIIQHMALFVALFSIINLNIGGLNLWDARRFIIINLSLVASMTTFASLLTYIIHKPKDSHKANYQSLLIALFALILWVAVFLIFYKVV